ncbi:MAG: hypothetical protein KatS3mg124_1675 [Porticoccaceae bacterium]|nr:MAG: hypothetical protein KatS3mg124_1675 [Porticoccaceae bacterium]
MAEGCWDALPQAPLWGRGRPCAAALADGEHERLARFAPWCHALEHAGLVQEAREVRLLPEGLEWRFCGEALELSFALPAGTYATALLRELAELVEPGAGQGLVL